MDLLKLQPHPEGGYYRETYRSEGCVATSEGTRAYSTTIYFLLESGQFSAWHRIRSDEGWHFYQGVPLHVYVLEPGGGLRTILLGNRPENGESFQAIIPRGRWFASRPAEPGGFSLVGCTVSPGFDFADFEMAGAETLIASWPAHSALINELISFAVKPRRSRPRI